MCVRLCYFVNMLYKHRTLLVTTTGHFYVQNSIQHKVRLELFPQGKSGLSVKPKTHLHLLSRFQMSAAIRTPPIRLHGMHTGFTSTLKVTFV